MNNPMSRKLFQTREAREKLRGMGGIMASSPELAQTVAKFQVGGDVTVPIVEGPNTAFFRQTREIGNTLSEMQARAAILQEQARRREAARQAARFSFPDFLQAEIPAVDEFSGLLPEMTQPGGTVEAGEDISRERVMDDLGLGPALAPIRERREEAELQEAAAAATERAIIPQMEQEMRNRAAQEEGLVAAERRRAVTGVQMEAEAEADDQESGGARQRLQAAQLAAAKVVTGSEESGGGETGAGDFDFDASFEQALDRVGRVMGDAGAGDDEDSRKKAMANLAMIGLAIAAGQSPDALTNIAQGALTGMQAMQAQQAREADLARESRLTALEMAESAADRASSERIAGMRTVTEGEETRQEYLYNSTFAAALTGIMAEGIPAEEAAARAAAIAAQAAPNAPSARSAGAAVPSVTAPPSTELTDTERELLGL